jgi:transcriptional regulator with XRE-family HTH domain
MAVFFAGAIIKVYRTNRGITQDKLCQGICNVSTLHRIEKGERVPSVFVFTRLMERLGFESGKYYVSASNSAEIHFFNKYYEAVAMLIDKKYGEVDAAIKTLKGLLRQLNKDEGVNIRSQMIFTLTCGVAQGRGEDTAEIHRMILDALLLTLPDFSEDSISDYMLSYDEISLINMLATTYKSTGDSERKIGILYQVKTSMDKYYYDEYEKSRGYSQTLYNLSNALGLAERHEEALEICEAAIRCCVKNKRLYLLPHLKFNKACAMFFTGDEGYKYLALEAVYALRNNEDYDDAERRKDYAEKKMNIVFPF